MSPRLVQATIGNLPDVLRRGKPVVVEFWANWCAPCHKMAPILRRLAKEFDAQVIFAKVDVDNNQDLTEQFAIRSIPTIIMFRHGKEWDRVSGLKSRPELEKIILKMVR